MSEGEADSIDSYLLALACLREELLAGRKLTPREMAERVGGKEE